MWSSNKNHIEDEKLDCCGEDVFRSFEPSEVEINNAANSAFLYRRIRVRIEEEERRRNRESNPWQALLMTSRRAIPAFLFAATVATVCSWYVHYGMSPNDYSRFQPDRSQQIVIGDVAALSSEEEASIVGWDESKTEAAKEH